MSDLSERHEVRLRGRDKTIVFLADSEDGRLIIRQEPDNKKPKDVCSITLSDPDELRTFFKGLRRIVASLEHGEKTIEPSGKSVVVKQRALEEPRPDDRDALVAQARQRNTQAFAPWTKDEEQEVKKRYESGESVQEIARARRRSPRAIDLRLQRLGLLPQERHSIA
jgi:hypothetical protein